MKKVIVIYNDKKEKLISLAIDEDYIEDIEYIKNRKIYRLCIRKVKGDIKWNRDTVNEIADV